MHMVIDMREDACPVQRVEKKKRREWLGLTFSAEFLEDAISLERWYSARYDDQWCQQERGELMQ